MDRYYVDGFRAKLREKAFDESLADRLSQFHDVSEAIIPIQARLQFDFEFARYRIFAEYNGAREAYEIVRFDAAINRAIVIPDVVVHGVRIRDLDRDLNDVGFNEGAVIEESLMQRLGLLTKNDHPVGRRVQEMLIAKYLLDTPYAKFFGDFEKTRAKYEVRRSFDARDPLQFDARQAYNLLSGRPVAVQRDSDRNSLIWVGTDTLSADYTISPVLKVIDDSEKFIIEDALERSPYAKYMDPALMEEASRVLKNGDRLILTPEVLKDSKGVVLVAEPWNDRIKKDLPAMVARGWEEAFDENRWLSVKEAQNPFLMESAAASLAQLGFTGIDLSGVKEKILYRDNNVVVESDMSRDGNRVHFEIELEYRNGDEVYAVNSVRARLIEGVPLTVGQLNDIEVLELDRKFFSITWASADWLNADRRNLRLLDVAERHTQAEVDSLMDELDRIDRKDPDGLTLKSKILFKHFAGTPNEKYVPNLKNMQERYSISSTFDEFSALWANSEQIYTLLQGGVVPRLFDAADDRPKTQGYLVLQEANGRGLVRWLAGPTKSEISKELVGISGIGFSSKARASEVASEVFDGRQFRSTVATGGGVELAIRLGQVGDKIELMVYRGRDEEINMSLSGELSAMAFGLLSIGFENAEGILRRKVAQRVTSIRLEAVQEFRGDKVRFEARIGLKDGAYKLDGIHVSMLKYIVVPDFALNVGSAADLEYRLSSIDWNQADYFQRGFDAHDMTPPGRTTPGLNAQGLLGELTLLAKSDDSRERWVAEALANKYLRYTPNEGFFEAQGLKYPYSVDFHFREEFVFHAELKMLYNLMDGRAVGDWVAEDNKAWFRKMTRIGRSNTLNYFKQGTGVIDRALSSVRISGVPQQKVKDSLLLGDLVELPIAFHDKVLLLDVHLDTEKRALVVTNFSRDSDVGNFLAVTKGWMVSPAQYPEAGQHRDWELYPVPLQKSYVDAVSAQLLKAGLKGFIDDEVLLMLRRGVPSFGIRHEVDISGFKITADVHFGPNTNAGDEVEFKSFDLKFMLADGRFSMIHSTGEIRPDLTLAQAVSIAAGAHIRLSDSADVDGWYSLDWDSRLPDGFMRLKREVFPVHEVIKQIDALPLQELATVEGRNGLIYSVVTRGQGLAHYTKEHGSAEVHIWFDLPDGKIVLTPTDELRSSQGKNQGRGDENEGGENRGRTRGSR